MRQNFFVFLGHFAPPPSPNDPENPNSKKKEKNPRRYYPLIMAPEILGVTDRNFGSFFATFCTLTT